MIRLYHTPNTRSQRVRWLLEECQLSYELVYIDLFNGEGNSASHLAIHPLGCVPVLEHNNQFMYESGAICHFLTSLYAADSLQPKIDSDLYKYYLQWMYFVTATMEPPLWEIQLHSWILPKEQRRREAITLANQRYHPVVEIINRELSTKPYLLGDDFSTVDILLSTTLTWHKKSLKKYPVIQAYVDKLHLRAGWLKSLEVPGVV